MEQGPLRQPDLPDLFLIRAELVHHAIADANLLDRASFLVNFQREVDPWQELQLWEWIAVAYRNRWRIRPGTELERKSWLTQLLLVSAGATAPQGDLTRALELEEARKALQDAARPGRKELARGVDDRILRQSAHLLAETLRSRTRQAVALCWNSINRLTEAPDWDPEEVAVRLDELNEVAAMFGDEYEALTEQIDERRRELEPHNQRKRHHLEEERRRELLRQSSLGNLFGQED